MTEYDKTREIRLRNTAKRQRLVLSKSRARDSRAVGYGQFQIMDEHNTAVAGAGYTMTMDDVEVYLAGADDFQVFFAGATHDESFNPHTHEPDMHMLEWLENYREGSGPAHDGWLLSENHDTPHEYFFTEHRNDLASVATKARAMLAAWFNERSKSN